MITPQQLGELERLYQEVKQCPNRHFNTPTEMLHKKYESAIRENTFELIAAARENDLLRTRLASVLLFGSEKMNQTQCGEIQKWCEEYPTQLAKENAELRKRVEELKKDIKELEKEMRYPSLPNYGLDPDPNE